MIMLPVNELKIGDFIDMEGDKYADPNGDNVALAYEWQEVYSLERETPTCIVIETPYITVGFPVDHVVRVRESEEPK